MHVRAAAPPTSEEVSLKLPTVGMAHPLHEGVRGQYRYLCETELPESHMACHVHQVLRVGAGAGMLCWSRARQTFQVLTTTEAGK